ncbi:resB-like family protein [Mycobacterium xenopi 4042]|uniref:ResB-like family protein n=1 Tax=Mycobacterium xenopi 4042 TaxID=1299334 RepID=X8CAU7_MYCXE|nr:resB-like family protein [Mycobacterium xenopi 4042]
MGTALVLLCLLALGAIPGALLPQRKLNAGKVDEYLTAHPLLGPWLDRLQMFDVFGSFWFTAIYVLLFVSLVGCLTPRTIEHVRSLRATRWPHPATWLGCPSTPPPPSPPNPTPWPRQWPSGCPAGARPSANQAAPLRFPQRKVTCANSATSCSTLRCWACWSRWPSASCSATRGT